MEMAVLGAGAFGTALAKILAGKGHAITLWCRKPERARQLAKTRESPYLAGCTLPAKVVVTSDLPAAVDGKALVLCVVPSHGIRALMTDAAGALHEDTILVNASKGIEEGTLSTIDQIFREVLPRRIAERAAFLSGPTFAKELVQGLPAAIVIASRVASSAALVQQEFSSDRLRVYSSEDVTGIELGGALKNVCAIGAGISDGLGYGHNARAALITRGIVEMTRLGMRLGANPLTFAGLAGIGDLILTCTGDLSRNRHVGLELGRGRRIADILASMQSVAEGVKTTKAARDLATRLAVEMPITEAIYAVLYDGKSPQEAVADLMRRELKSERW
ncbi:MAG: NAD(P)-dependent glycerol-3-phosphate dehydrogenase [Deltaproteobacteria bacterium]|nr:NAD(P)-dependent glycerol-3-phosphate dehydrogenase [Deltaproteobacteria bacterium]